MLFFCALIFPFYHLLLDQALSLIPLSINPSYQSFPLYCLSILPSLLPSFPNRPKPLSLKKKKKKKDNFFPLAFVNVRDEGMFEFRLTD